MQRGNGICCSPFDVVWERLIEARSYLTFEQGKENPARQIACRYDREAEHGLRGACDKCARNPPVVHVRHAVLGAAEDEARNPHEEGRILADLMRVLGIAVDCYENEDVADDAEDEKRNERVSHFRGDHCLSDCVDAFAPANTGHTFRQGEDAGSYEVARPDQKGVPKVFQIVVENVADLSGEKAVAPGADGEQAHGEKNRPDDVAPREGILEAKENRSAESDAHARQNRAHQDFLHRACLLLKGA